MPLTGDNSPGRKVGAFFASGTNEPSNCPEDAVRSVQLFYGICRTAPFAALVVMAA
jgi:hypothetical protein